MAVRVAGLAASFVLVCGLAWVLQYRLAAGEVPAIAAVTGSVLVVAGSLLSDLPGWLLWGFRAPSGCFCCGNWGLLVPRAALHEGRVSRELFPPVCESLLLSVLDIVELRGAQAGGVNTFLSQGGKQVKAVAVRALKTKRGRLGIKIFSDFCSKLRWQRLYSLTRCKPLRGMPTVLAQGHSRFGTSSGPAVNETHPHRWVGPRWEHVWRCERGDVWSRESQEVCTTITHNGDFDGWKLFGKVVPNSTLGLWLSRVHHCTNAAKGDSPKLAGMMDLLLCQGMWLPSVRFAFVTEILKHEDEVFGWETPSEDAPNHSAPQSALVAWARVFDDCFSKLLDSQPRSGRSWGRAAKRGYFDPTDDRVLDLVDKVVEILEASGSDHAVAKQSLEQFGISGDHLKNFVRRACKNFFHMDLLSAVQVFFSQAEGTFGVSASCNLWPSSIVLAAKGQPISLAIDPSRPLVFWSSEPSSLLVGWPERDSYGSTTRAARARWDMNDAVGEALELRMFEGGTAEEHISAWQDQSKLLGKLSESLFFPMPDVETDEQKPYHLLIRGVSLDSTVTALAESTFASRWVLLQQPPPNRKLGAAKRYLDPVAQDLHDVPSVLQQVEDAWGDHTSLNYRSGRKFGHCLSELLMAKQRGEGTAGSIDVLIFGIENSLWLGQQFAADLKNMMPMLNITALSSNWLLGMLQEAHGHLRPRNFALSRHSFRFTPGAVVLGLSHSGTTYPTVWAARALHRQHGVHVNLFAMSSVFDTVLANSIGQDLSQPEFTGVLFSTMAGLRPAEPSTVATLAMHHTLSLLLYASVQEVQGSCPEKNKGKRKRMSTPFVGKWVDTSKEFCAGVIDIQENSWAPETFGERFRKSASYALEKLSERTWRLIEIAPEGTRYAFDASPDGDTLRVALAGILVRSEDGEDVLDVNMDTSLAWTLHRHSSVTMPVLTVNSHDVRDMLPVLHSLLPAAEELCGVTRNGVEMQKPSEVRSSVLQAGRYLASHLLEGWYSLLLSAMYVYITVTVGFPVFGGVWGQVLDKHSFDDGQEWWWQVAMYVVAFVDAHFYVFLAAVLTTAHRLFTGRRLFVRYTGKSLVIVDCTVNYKLLRAYVSKLRALAFRFTTFAVSGQNGEDHFVHEMTHLTTSEVVILAGRPDGRLGTLASSEAANIMSLQQARFIAANPYTGVEIVSVGHNPWKKAGLFEKTVELSSEHRPLFHSQELLRSGSGAHSPADIVHGLAMLAEGDLSKAGNRNANQSPFAGLRVEDIQSKMDGELVDLETAQVVIQDLVEEFAMDLRIDPEAFDCSQVLNGEVAAQFAGKRFADSRMGKVKSLVSPFKSWEGGLQNLDESIFSGSKSVKSRDAKLSASNIMVVLRGRKLEGVIMSLQLQRQKEMTIHRQTQGDSMSKLWDIVNPCFRAWAQYRAMCVQEREEREAKEATEAREEATKPTATPQVAAWRTQEEYRQRRRQWMSHYSTLPFGVFFTQSRCFEIWKDNTSFGQVSQLASQMSLPTSQKSAAGLWSITLKKAQACSRPTRGSKLVVGEHCGSKARAKEESLSGKELLKDLSYMESVYETRVAAAERLLAFYILFHAAVRPLSRLWGLRFDMDRSESRLRVASTPAPVPFVESMGSAELIPKGVERTVADMSHELMMDAHVESELTATKSELPAALEDPSRAIKSECLQKMQKMPTPRDWLSADGAGAAGCLDCKGLTPPESTPEVSDAKIAKRSARKWRSRSPSDTPSASCSSTPTKRNGHNSGTTGTGDSWVN